jgi:SAM-dependent methyltransferase
VLQGTQTDRADVPENAPAGRNFGTRLNLRPPEATVARMQHSAAQIALRLAGLGNAQRVLLVTPGPHGARILPPLLEALSGHRRTVLDSAPARLAGVSADVCRAQGRATRLPFKRHSFDAVLSFEALYAIRPPWTVLAEFHRVLRPDGVLLLLEPATHGFFSRLRDKISGPGKRVFTPDEVKQRLARADFEVRTVEPFPAPSDMSWPVYCALGVKKENPAEPVPQFKTAREMIEARQKKFPSGEELP